MKTTRPTAPMIDHASRLVRVLAAIQRDTRRRPIPEREAALAQLRQNSAKISRL